VTRTGTFCPASDVYCTFSDDLASWLCPYSDLAGALDFPVSERDRELDVRFGEVLYPNQPDQSRFHPGSAARLDVISAKCWSHSEPSLRYRSSQRIAAFSNFGDPRSAYG